MKRFNATTLQYTFIGLIIVMIGNVIGIFLLAQHIMGQKALATDHARIDAELAQEELVRLQQLKSNLAKDKATIDKTARIVAQSQQYEYQDQVVKDINSYAKQYGIDILSYDFGAKPGVAPNSSTGGSTQQKSIVQVQLNDGIPYTSFLKFLKSIEENITKMQLTGIALQPNAADPSLVQGSTIEIEVFLR